MERGWASEPSACCLGVFSVQLTVRTERKTDILSEYQADISIV